MKLSAEGKLRLSARLVFAMGVGVISADAFAANVAADVAEADEQAATSPGAGADAATPATGPAVQAAGVQVTGSRIKSANLTGNAPVTTVGSQELQFQGTTRVEDLLNSLPQVFADQGANISNGSDGTATLNLRNLGNTRTLVLIDGKRVQPGSPTAGTGAADLNFIPAAMIDKIDVLTGGASSVYGADAVAGVVNFIMKKDFEGVRLDYQRSGYYHDNHSIYAFIPKAKSVTSPGYTTPDGSSFDGGGDIITGVMGINSGDGKGNITAYATFQHNDSLSQAQRDFSACTFAESGTDSFACSGSSTTGPGGRFQALTNPNGMGAATPYTLDPATGNTFRNYSTARDAFNFGPYNYYLRNDERYGLGAFGHYKFSEMAEAYTSLMFSDDHTDAVIAPSGAFNGTTFTIPCNSPLLSADEFNKLCAAQNKTANQTAQLLIGRRNIEGGGRDSDLRHTAYRIVLGLKGDISDAWSYDVSGQYGTTLSKQIYRNDFSKARLQRALNVVSVNGTPTCQSVVDRSDPNCVPYDIFALAGAPAINGTPRGVSAAALAYLQTPGFQTGQAEEQVVTGSLSGQLGKYGLRSPVAKDGVAVALGSEYRREYIRTEVDNEFATNDLAGQGGATLPSAGGFNVREVFGEVRVPLIQDRFLAKDLAISGGYRFSDYSSTSSTDTYKIDGDWAPVSDLRFRGGFNRAVRTPNVAELSSPLNVALDGSTDPCAGAIGANGVVSGGATRAQCANDPLIRANPQLYGQISENPASQYNGQTGTQPGLKPETADTYTGGVVITPRWVKDLSISVDYFDIRVKDAIGGYGADTILDTCYTKGSLCNLINRNPNGGAVFGSLWLGSEGYVVDTTTNTGSFATHGIDVVANYRLKLSRLGLSNRAGTFSFDFVGTRLINLEIQAIPTDPSTSYTCNGLYGLQCGTPVPNWRHKLRGTYTVPTYWLDSTVTASAAWRYIGAVRADNLSAPNNADRRLPSFSYLDLTASISFKSAYTFRVGVNNVLDKDPPIIGSGALPGVFGNGNTFPQVYDALGRYAFAGVTLDF